MVLSVGHARYWFSLCIMNATFRTHTCYGLGVEKLTAKHNRIGMNCDCGFEHDIFSSPSETKNLRTQRRQMVKNSRFAQLYHNGDMVLKVSQKCKK
jgi:hypothetical protein